MKKIFSFAAVLFAAVAINAQTVYDFTSIAGEDDLTVTVGTKNTSESSDSKLVYDIPAPTTEGESSTMSIVVKKNPNVLFELSNKAAKTKAMAVGLGEGKSYVEFSGKNGILTINRLNVGDAVTLSVCAKGSTDAILTVVEGAAETAEVTLPAKVDKASEQAGKDGYDANGYFEKEVKYTAIAPSIKLKETANGYRIHTITVGTASGVEDLNASAVKAQKVMENGQIYILKNGVKYNLLGAEVK